MSNQGTIMLRAFTDVDGIEQYIFEGKDENDRTIGLYRNESGYLTVNINGTSYTSTIKMTSNLWHTVGLSYSVALSGDSLGNNTINFRIYYDGAIYESSKLLYFNYKALNFMIGRRYTEESCVTNLGIFKTSYPLYGQIEMLSVRESYCTKELLDNLTSELLSYSKVSEYDEFGMLKKADVHKNGRSILSNTYDYKTRSNTNYISKLVYKENIKYGSTSINRSYTYDNIGRLLGITDSIFGNHSYEYDYRGYLVRDEDMSYTYDDNGNILTAGTNTYVYDSTIKDKLIKYNGSTILYNGANPLNIIGFDGKSFNYEGRRLVYIKEEVDYNGEDVEKWTFFTYNEQGLITKKSVQYVDGYTFDVLDEESTNYFYEENNLVTEINTYYRLDFLYDENNRIYGLIYNNSSKYFYVRDVHNNILGLVDINGNLVVKYKCDSFGNLLSKTDTSGIGLSYKNPFIYKGYYYDTDLEMYYCKSRFYVPKLRRWLNADNINYLEPDNINGLNLFMYCANDPINKYDPNGNFWFTALTTLVGAVVGATSSFVTALITEEELSWKTIAGGAVSGAVAGFVLGISKGTAIGLASYSSAAAEAVFYEACDYADGKELSLSNISKSIVDVTVDTLINGSINYCCNLVSANIPSIKTNSGWFIPKHISSYFGKTYGQRMIAQTIVAGIGSVAINSACNNTKNGINGCIDEIFSYFQKI